MSDIILTEAEIQALTGYEAATKQLQTLHDRGFRRAWINRHGQVVLERAHYEAVSRGEVISAPGGQKKADLSFLRAA